MSRFDYNYAIAFAIALLATHGESIIYTPRATGLASEIQAIVTPVTDEVTGQLIKSSCELTISAADVATPVAGDSGVVRGRSFRVDEVTQEDGVWRLKVSVS